MNLEIIIILALLLFAVASFVWEKISSDTTSFIVFSVLVCLSLVANRGEGVANPDQPHFPALDQLLGVLSSEAPLTIIAMFIISAALNKTGAIDTLADFMGRFTNMGYRLFLMSMIIIVAIPSAFVNNTPVVIVLLPVVLSLSRQMSVPASKLLIPLSYASIFGGVCTLVGTSTNLLASGLLEEPLGMFELSWVGVPLLFTAAAYLVLFGNRLLPHRETLTAILSEDERREYLTEAYLRKGSTMIGKSVAESGIQTKGVRVLEIIRQAVALTGDIRDKVLQEGDRLVLACRPSGFAHARSVEGLDLISQIGIDVETISAHEGAIVEGVIGPSSSLVEKNLASTNFRQRFRLVLLAVHRNGENVREKFGQLNFQFGDTLLLMGTDQAIEDLRNSEDILLLDRPRAASRSQRGSAPLVVAVLAAVVGVAAITSLPIVATALIGVGILVASRCITMKEAYRSIEWSILALIYGMLALGLAMQTTGAANLIATTITEGVQLIFPEHLWPYALLAAIFLCTSVLTEMLSNNATVVLMTPIALILGAKLGYDPRPFVIATCIASSASFSTPIGYQTNTYVYGVGGYRFKDFLKIGIPLNLLYFIVSVVIIPFIWPFDPAEIN